MQPVSYDPNAVHTSAGLQPLLDSLSPDDVVSGYILGNAGIGLGFFLAVSPAGEPGRFSDPEG